jgi:hypothetical protein
VSSLETGVAGEAQGQIRMFGTGTGYTTIKPSNNSARNTTITLPDDNGTLATIDNIVAGTGMTKVTEGDSITLNHTNEIEAGTAKGSDDKILAFNGAFDIPTITYDAEGHITETGTTTMTMPKFKEVSSPDPSGTDISFIDSISQNANGEITVSKKTVRNAGAEKGVVRAGGDVSISDGLITVNTTTFNSLLKIVGVELTTENIDDLYTSDKCGVYYVKSANLATIKGQVPSGVTTGFKLIVM